jgi:hypothetical protein
VPYNPYRTKSCEPPPPPRPDPAKLRIATVSFGIACAVLAGVFAGASRAKIALLTTLGGAALIATRRSFD